MLISKYTSSKEAINNFFRNTAYNDLYNLGDAAYWVYECMELIGFPLQYIPKIIGYKGEESYQLENYRIELPTDFHKLIAISVDGVMAVPSQSSFHHMLDGGCCGFEDASYSDKDLFYDNFGNTFSPQALPLNTRIVASSPTFTINNNYITFDIKEGKVCMAYYAFPLDDEGFPLIPDDVKYKRAVASYLQMRIDYILWRQEMLSDKVYMKSEEDWRWNVASASSHLKMPELNQMESLRRQLTKMIVRNEDFRTAFSTINARGHRGRY
jgi:hypothetical protein